MSRPKTSVLGIGDFFLSVYNARKVRKNSTDLETYSSNFAKIDQKMNLLFESQAQTSQMIIHNTVATMEAVNGLMLIKSEIDSISERTWDLLNFMSEMDRKEEILGTLRLFLIEVEEEIERIVGSREHYPEFTAAILDELSELFIENDVTLDKFKRMQTVEDIKWAKKVMRDLENLHLESLRERELNPEHLSRFNLMIDSMNKIAENEDRITKLTPDILQMDDDPESILEKIALKTITDRKQELSEKFKIIEEDFLEIKSKYNSDLENFTIPQNMISYTKNNPEAMKQLRRSHIARVNRRLTEDIKELAWQFSKADGANLDHKDFISEIEEWETIDNKIEKMKQELARDSSLMQEKIEEAKELYQMNLDEINDLQSEIDECYKYLAELIPNQRVDARNFSSLSDNYNELL